MNSFENKMHVQIGNILMKKYHIKNYSGNLYIYNKGIYSDDISILERNIIKLNPNITKRIREEIFSYIKIIKSEENISASKNYINFKNYLYDIKNSKILPHTPSIFTINQINAEYINDTLFNEDVEKFLNDITNNNSIKRKAILEIIGYSMTSSVDFQKAFVFYGKTAENGKSTLLEIILNLIGKDNTCHVTIHDLQKGKFYASEIGGKLLNTVAELPRTKLDSVELFKAVVTGDSLSVEKKYKDRYTITPYAKHIFTANELPKISDTTNGFYRRLNILEFDASFTDNQKRDFDISKLLNENALNYLAKISLEAYIELLKRRHFSNEVESNKIIENYKNQNNSVNEYLYDSSYFEIFINKNTTFTRKSLYNNYRDFCDISNIKILEGKNSFYEKIRDSKLFEEGFSLKMGCWKRIL